MNPLYKDPNGRGFNLVKINDLSHDVTNYQSIPIKSDASQAKKSTLKSLVNKSASQASLGHGKKNEIPFNQHAVGPNKLGKFQKVTIDGKGVNDGDILQIIRHKK